MRRMLLVPMLVAFILAGCEDRPPISRAQVVSNAYNLQLRDGLTWGDAVETLPPGAPDDRGHRWWQVRYRPGNEGAVRIILVDAESGWARHVPEGYVPRLPQPPKITGDRPLSIAEGTWIVVVTPARAVDAEQRRALEQEALRLNALGTNTGLVPLFSLREQRDQQVSLVYGWQHDRGIAREPRVVDWLTARTPYRDMVWENLAPAP
jgi:hypothetical protein